MVKNIIKNILIVLILTLLLSLAFIPAIGIDLKELKLFFNSVEFNGIIYESFLYKFIKIFCYSWAAGIIGYVLINLVDIIKYLNEIFAFLNNEPVKEETNPYLIVLSSIDNHIIMEVDKNYDKDKFSYLYNNLLNIYNIEEIKETSRKIYCKLIPK